MGNNQVQEAQRVPYRINPRRNTPRHILIKLSKIRYKEKILRAARQKQQITYQGIPIRLTADFSAETLQTGQPRRNEQISGNIQTAITKSRRNRQFEQTNHW